MPESQRGCPNCAAGGVRLIRRVKVSKARVPARLLHCSSCDFLWLADPTWLSVAYEDAFYGDTGYVDRNLHASRLLRLLISIGTLLGLEPVEPGCDIGTGLGMLPRMMRDHGYDFHGSDAYAAMELIRPFCRLAPDAPIPLQTAFEVIEHVPETAPFLAEHLGDGMEGKELFVFSTLLRAEGEIPGEEWWYYAFGNGQHIAFHSARSFRAAMARAGLDPAWLVTIDGPVHPRAIHAIAPRPAWRRAFRVAGWLMNSQLGPPLLPLLERLTGRRCLIIPDHDRAMDLLSAGREPAGAPPAEVSLRSAAGAADR